MIVLVANLGSTSFKYKLFDMDRDESVLAEGAADRIGQGNSAWKLSAGTQQIEGTADLPDHGAAIDLHMQKLEGIGVSQARQLDAIGFKAVHGGHISGAVRVDENVMATMQRFADVAPAHNPIYLAAMKAFGQRMPEVPQSAAFETAFHQTIPQARQVYAIPHEWIENLGVRRYGFHGASHRYIATRMAERQPDVKRLVSCHLGGSSSLCAINQGCSVATSFGLTPQSGVPQSGRVGDFEIFALLKLCAEGIDIDTVLQRLGKESGLLGLSGVSADMRDIEDAAAKGNERAQLAIDVFVEAVRHYLGAYLAVLNGAQAICFTGGIGQHQAAIRRAVLQDMDYAGIHLDEQKNRDARGSEESRIDAPDSRVQIWVLPTNEELIVARQTVDVLRSGASAH